MSAGTLNPTPSSSSKGKRQKGQMITNDQWGVRIMTINEVYIKQFRSASRQVNVGRSSECPPPVPLQLPIHVPFLRPLGWVSHMSIIPKEAVKLRTPMCVTSLTNVIKHLKKTTEERCASWLKGCSFVSCSGGTERLPGDRAGGWFLTCVFTEQDVALAGFLLFLLLLHLGSDI